MDERDETSRCSSKFISETCLQIPDYLSNGKNVSVFHQSCPSYIITLDNNSIQSGPRCGGLSTQHMFVVVYQCFVTAYHSLEDGTNRLS